MKKLTLKDLEIRYENIRKSKPNAKNCTVKGCKNPRDSTNLLGEDTCCAYHRLLFDFWVADVCRPLILNRRARRRAFTIWRNKMGKGELDKLVLRMALEPINWEC